MLSLRNVIGLPALLVKYGDVVGLTGVPALLENDPAGQKLHDVNAVGNAC